MKLKSRNSTSVNKLQSLKQQQDYIIQSINELNEKNQSIIKDYMNKQQQLTDQLQKQHQQITIQELKLALHNNIWTQKVGFFLNPLSQQSGQKITIQQQQILLKHSETKLILIERIFQTEFKIIQFQEQKKMIQNDVEGRILQMNTLLIEYEELEQIIDTQQNRSHCNNVKTIFQINKNLSQLKHNYMQLANQRQEKEIWETDIQKIINNLENNLKCFQIEKQMKGLQSSWFNVDQLYNLIISNAKSDQQLDLFSNIVLLINERIVQGLNQKENQNGIIENIQQIENDNNFRVFNSAIFQEYLDYTQIVEYSQFLIMELPKRICKFKIESKLKQYKTQLIEVERQIHQIMYEQSMIQTQYNRLESNLPILEQNETAQKLQKILNRMNHIECLKSQNKILFEITFPAQIKQIQDNLFQMEQQLHSQIKELQYSISIEQDYYYRIFTNQSLKLPILILDLKVVNNDIEQQIEENRKEYQQQQILYNQKIENNRQKLKQLEEEENKMETGYLIELNESILKSKKENIPPSDSRDMSILGTIQIDMSQERTTHKYSVFRSKKQLFMNEPTDRSLSVYSFLGHRSSDPLCSKTKLALKQQTNLSSQTFQKNPLLSPQSNNHHISIEQSLSLHSSARRFPDYQIEKSPPPQIIGEKIYKVLKRVYRQQSTGNKNGYSAFSSKFVKYNQKMKFLEFYNSNKMIHDLGQKESVLCLKQIREIKQTSQSLILVISKHQSIELVFSKYEQLNEFMKMITYKQTQCKFLQKLFLREQFQYPIPFLLSHLQRIYMLICDYNHLELLGVPRNSSQNQIFQKEYYGLVKKYHPDANPSKDAKEKGMLQNLSAYQTLSDKNKRRVYDQVGMTGDEQQQEEAQDHFAVYSSFFRQGGRRARGQDLEFDESIFDDFVSFIIWKEGVKEVFKVMISMYKCKSYLWIMFKDLKKQLNFRKQVLNYSQNQPKYQLIFIFIVIKRSILRINIKYDNVFDQAKNVFHQ